MGKQARPSVYVFSLPDFIQRFIYLLSSLWVFEEKNRKSCFNSKACVMVPTQGSANVAVANTAQRHERVGGEIFPRWRGSLELRSLTHTSHCAFVSVITSAPVPLPN